MIKFFTTQATKGFRINLTTASSTCLGSTEISKIWDLQKKKAINIKYTNNKIFKVLKFYFTWRSWPPSKRLKTI